MRCRVLTSMALALTGAGSARAEATIVTDPTFFDRVPHALIDFETFGDGSPVSLPEGGVDARFGHEYTDLGIRLSLASYLYGNPAPSDLETAHMAIGSGDILMGFERQGASDPPAMAFTNGPARSFGFAFVRNTARDTAMTLTLIDVQGELITFFTQDDFVTLGQVGDLEYGFAWMTSDTPFRSVVFNANTFNGVFFDDIRFGASPSPGTGVVVVAGLVAAHRHRRALAPMRTIKQEPV